MSPKFSSNLFIYLDQSKNNDSLIDFNLFG